MEFNQDTQDEYFNCQEECNTPTEKYILSTSCTRYIWVLPLTIYTQHTPDHTKKISPPHLEIDFLLDSGATLNILNNDTWNKIKEYHSLRLKASTFVLSAANNTKLQSNGSIKLKLYPDLSVSRTLKDTSFTLIFHNSNRKFIILGTHFLENYVDSFRCSSHTLEIKDGNETKPIKFYDSSTTTPPYYSRLFPVIRHHSI